MGVSVSELPIAKAQRAAEELTRINPPPVFHERPEPDGAAKDISGLTSTVGEVPTGEVPTGEVPTGEVPTGEAPTPKP